MVPQVVTEELAITEERAARTPVRQTLTRDAVVFLAGAEALHTLSHIWLGVSGMLPMAIRFPSMTVTQGLNLFAIGVNALVTLGLLYWAKRLTK